MKKANLETKRGTIRKAKQSKSFLRASSERLFEKRHKEAKLASFKSNSEEFKGQKEFCFI